MNIISRCGLLQRSLIVMQETKRFGTKVNLRKPRRMHFAKALMVQLTKPYLVPWGQKDTRPLSEKCQKQFENKYPKERNIYQEILAKECLDLFRKSKIVGFFHLNYMKAEDRFNAFLQLRKNNMVLRVFGRKTIGMALRSTEYEAVMKIICSHNMLVFCDHNSPSLFLTITKKFRDIIFLAAIYENRFMSKEEFVKFSEIPDLKTAQSHFVHALNGLGQDLNSKLQTHQNKLIQTLDQIKDLKS